MAARTEVLDTIWEAATESWEFVELTESRTSTLKGLNTVRNSFRVGVLRGAYPECMASPRPCSTMCIAFGVGRSV